MIVGNGLLARAFESFKDDPKVLIFASGVSNSSNKDQSEFEKEVELLKRHSDQKIKIVYFSTVSLSDKSLVQSPYVVHKKRIEEEIPKFFEEYIILRLPNLVGKTNNPHTMTNFFFSKVNAGDKLTIQNKASRYLMDVDDVHDALVWYLENVEHQNGIYNLPGKIKLPVIEIVESIQDFLGKKTEIELVDKGENYDVRNHDAFSAFFDQRKISPTEYFKQILNKYYKD